MRKIRLDGSKVKQLRVELDQASTQKEFAHEIQISERKLRAVENENAIVSAETANRIARVLGQPVQALLISPPSPPATADASQRVVKSSRREILPRFDDYPASVIRDEASLFDHAKDNRVLISHVLTPLTAETSAYSEELLAILKRLTWDGGNFDNPISGLEEIAVRRRLRELLILLKGNDVWVYGDTNIKMLPESFEVLPPGIPTSMEFQAIIAFGPPGEYSETSIRVPIDNGQPREVIWP